MAPLVHQSNSTSSVIVLPIVTRFVTFRVVDQVEAVVRCKSKCNSLLSKVDLYKVDSILASIHFYLHHSYYQSELIICYQRLR